MNAINIAEMLPADFDNKSKVWIYQSTRPFTEEQAREIDEQILQFTSQWQVHGKPAKGWGKLLFNRFVVMMADETFEAISGCSTDSMVRIVKSIERQYDCNLFDRLSITFLVKGKAEVLPMNQVQFALDKGYINADTLLFNNLVSTKREMQDQWLQPLSQSWMASKLNFNTANTSS